MEQLKLSDLLSEDLIFFGVEAENRTQLLTNLSEILFQRGYVKESFLHAVLEREAQYPTGLPTQMIKIAVPHTDIQHVNKAGILIASLKEPIMFKDMGNGVDDIPVELVFMLSINAPKEHVLVLQQIIGLFCDDKVLSQIKAAQNPKALLSIIGSNVYEVANPQ